DLQRQWLSINFEIPSFCAYERQTTYNVSVVTQASASNLCNRRLDPIDANHLTIVKPNGPRDTPYLALKAAIQLTPGKASSDFTPKIIRPVAAFLNHKEAVTAEYIGDNKLQVHTAFVRIRLRFLEERFNKATYFSAFDSISAKWHPKQGNGKVTADFISSVMD